MEEEYSSSSSLIIDLKEEMFSNLSNISNLDLTEQTVDNFCLTKKNNKKTSNETIPNEDLSNLDGDTLTSIARSAFADMLWDQERNYLYKKAIKKVLTNLLISKQNEKLNLLDIGAGTGLLSMFMYQTITNFLDDRPHLTKNNTKIFALEQFFYSYLTAKDIISLNQMNDKINLIYKSSLSKNFDDDDLKNELEKCDFLTTEVFDTELIGEGALEIFRSAKQSLLKPNSLIVPKKAHIYCQLIENKFLTNGHLFRPIRIKDGEKTIVLEYRDEINECPGSCAQLNDLQLNSLNINEFKIVSDVQIAFIIDFENPPDNRLEFKQISFKILNKPKQFSNVCIAVWWDLNMDYEGEIVLSCAPYWARRDVNYEQLFANELTKDVSVFFKSEEKFKGHRDVNKELNDLKEGFFKNYVKILNENANLIPLNIEQNFEKLRLSSQWRDHWMQAVYFLPKDSLKNPVIDQITKNFEIKAYRNDYQFWFNYQNPTVKVKSFNNHEDNIQQACSCGYHRIYSRNQIRQINDHQLTNTLSINFSEVYREFESIKGSKISSSQMDTSDVSSPTTIEQVVTKKLKKENLCNVLVVGGMGMISLIIAKLVPESILYLFNQTNSCPFYKEIIYKERLEDRFLGVKNCLNFNAKIDILVKDPCTNINNLPWLDVHEFLLSYRSILGRKIPLVLPNKIIFKIMPVCFDHLWKIRYVIQKIDGLDLSPFHKMIDKALEIEPRKIEMYSLHEYDGIALDLPKVLSLINVANMDTYKGETKLNFKFNCNKIRHQLTKLYGQQDKIESKRSIFDQQLDKVLPFIRTLSNISFVIWPEYARLVNTGSPSVKIDYSSRINWNKLFKQAVYFIPELNRDCLDSVQNLNVNINLKYDFNLEENLFKLDHEWSAF